MRTVDLAEVATSSARCQRWHNRRPSWTHADPAERFDHRRYDVAEILDDTTPREYVEAHHYLGSYPSARRRYGLYRAGELVGVAVYSIPVQKAVLTGPLPDLVPYYESLELGRLLLADAEPGNAESWFVARCHERLLAAGVRGVVSFADPVPRHTADGVVVAPGHVGFIYQALSAIYTGRGTARTLLLLPDGTTLNSKTAQKIRQQECGHEAAERKMVALGARPMRAGEKPAMWLAEALDDVGVRRLRHRGCHRYVFRIGKAHHARKQLAAVSQPYPKGSDA